MSRETLQVVSKFAWDTWVPLGNLPLELLSTNFLDRIFLESLSYPS